ncbi:MAG: PKD domain-containing protein [Dehalococcoidales bacterium]|nr:PKD domain-containing protein [Dehalococcoidales bacterium]
MTITVSNVSPVVDAGDDITINEGENAYFNGVFKDPGWLDTHTFEWNVGDIMPPVQGTLTPTHEYTDNGIYTVILTITDDDGGTGTDTLTVTVLDLTPRADFKWSPEPQDEGSPVQFTDSSSSYPDSIVAWDWDFAGLGSSSEQNPSFIFPDNGTYPVTLRVTDDDGSMDTVIHTVTVQNIAPTVDGGPDVNINEGDILNGSGSFFDPGADSWNATVDYGDESGIQSLALNSDKTFELSHKYADNGMYNVTITVIDDDSGAGVSNLLVTVSNVAPSTEVIGDTIAENDTATIIGLVTDPGALDSFTVVIDWGVGEDSTTLELPAGAMNYQATHQYLDDNPTSTSSDTYTVQVTITDKDGGAGIAQTTVIVNNLLPVVSAGSDQTQYWGIPINFTGSFSDVGTQDTHDVLWVFGDGGTASSIVASHTYEGAGAYTAKLTVTDDDAGEGSDNAEVMVNKRTTSLDYIGNSNLIFGSTVTLSAQFTDTVDATTARLGGRTITFTINGGAFSAVTDANGIAVLVLPYLLLPDTYGITVDFPEDSYYLGSADQATLVVTNTIGGKVTAGTLRAANNGRGGFNVQSNANGIKGELQFQNKSINFHAHEMTALGISPDGTKAWFAGVGTDGETFIAYVEDNGEPGKDDVFKIWIDGVLQNGDGGLTGGNVQIH